MTNLQALDAAAKLVKKAFPIGKAVIGALLAMPTATVILNKLKGYDPKKALQVPPTASLPPDVYKQLADRLAAIQAGSVSTRPNPLLRAAQGLQSYRRIYS